MILCCKIRFPHGNMRKCCLPLSGACLGKTQSEKLYDAQNNDEKRESKICDSFHVASACEGIFSLLYSILRKEKLLVSQTMLKQRTNS